jgi:hypothetical protein
MTSKADVLIELRAELSLRGLADDSGGGIADIVIGPKRLVNGVEVQQVLGVIFEPDKVVAVSDFLKLNDVLNRINAVAIWKGQREAIG